MDGLPSPFISLIRVAAFFPSRSPGQPRGTPCRARGVSFLRAPWTVRALAVDCLFIVLRVWEPQVSLRLLRRHIPRRRWEDVVLPSLRNAPRTSVWALPFSCMR